ncbi:hypothetical protein ACFWNR_06460 [Streptomyces virginiae]|uniref:hypothetical protein n=1 Tax=Streptomyces virginiae TaxID=1961 RepID=UPI0036519DEA
MHYHRLRYHGSTDRPGRSWEERFWEKVDKTPNCWIWTGARDRAGYGLLGGNAPMRAAHRLSRLLAVGNPGDQHVLHRCDNPPCVRPDHLFVGDDATNHADMAAKLRSTWGEKNAHAKLTEGEVRQIRALLAQGMLHREIAGQFGISRGTVSDIHRGRSWKNLD